MGFTRDLRKRWMFLTCIGVILGIAATGCGSSSSSSSGDSAKTGGSGSGASSITIGAVCDQSGTAVAFGQACQQGLQMGVQQVNGTDGFVVGGKHYTLKLDVQDGHSDPTETAAVTEKLISDQGVKFLFGPDLSTTVLQSTAITKGKNVLQITAGADVQPELGTPGHTMLFGVVIKNTSWVGTIGPMLKKVGVPSGKVAVVYPDDATGTSLAPTFTSILKGFGYTPVVELFPATTTNFLPLATKLKSQGVSAVVTGYDDAITLPIARAVAQIGGVKAIAAIGSLPQDVPLKIQAETGHPYPIPYAYLTSQPTIASPTTPGVAAFRALWVGLHLDPTTLYASQALAWWDQPVHLLVAAMQKAGTTTDPAAVAAALNQVSNSSFISDYHFQNNLAVYGTDAASVLNGQTKWYYFPPGSTNPTNGG